MHLTFGRAPSRTDHPARPTAVWLGSILVVALVLRWLGLHEQSLTMDEIADIASAAAPVRSVIHTPDGFPPLYGVLLHGWLTVVPGEDNARWLSLLLGLIAIPIMWLLGAQVGGPRVGLIAALALALSPLHRWFSQEARAYVLYLLAAVSALWLFERAMTTQRPRDWLLYAAVCIAGLYTHYYFALLPLTAGLVLLADKRSRRALAPGLIANAVIALACLPLLGLLRGDLTYQAGYALDAPFNMVTAGYAYFTTVAGFSLGPSLRELHTLPVGPAVQLVFPWILLMTIALLLIVVGALTKPESRPAALRLLAFILVPGLVGGVLAEVAGVGFRARYVAWVVIPMIALIALGLASIRRIALRTVAACALAVISAVSITNRITAQRYWNEDVAAAAAYLRSNASPSAPVFVMSKYMAVPVAHYLGEPWTVCALPDADRPDGTADPSAALHVIASRTPGDSPFWLIYTRPFHSDRGERVPRALLGDGRTRARAEFAGITLYEGVVPAGSPMADGAPCADPNPMNGAGETSRVPRDPAARIAQR